MTIAVDFDGTIVTNEFPHIGKPNMQIINKLIQLKKSGAKLILWTCRVGQFLNVAIDFCTNIGLEFDAINENLPEVIEHYGSDCRKIVADYYLDDRALDLKGFLCFLNGYSI